MKKIIQNHIIEDDNQIEALTYQSEIEGKNLLIFGAIHGNETCGPESIKIIIEDIKQGLINIVSGSVTFIPITNPKAYNTLSRFYNIDLGRNFDSKNILHEYEKKVVSILEEYIRKSDYFLDIHSTAAKTNPCIFEDWPDENTHNFSQSIGVPSIITGWPEIYAESNSPDASMYAHQQGKTGILIECGSHKDDTAQGIGVQSIKNSLQFLGITDTTEEKKILPSQSVHMQKLYIKEKEGHLSKNWSNLEPIQSGEIIGYYDDGETISAPDNGFIVLPKLSAEVGAEWFYFGIQG